MGIKKIDNGREYRDLILNISQEEQQNYRVEGYASTYNEPYHLYTSYAPDGYAIEIREQVDRHAFDDADMSDVIMQYNHEGRVFARQSNKTLSLDTNDDKGLFITADLGGTTIGRELYEEIKGGYTTKMSFGFNVDKNKDTFEQISSDENGEVWLRTINAITKVFDVSAVSIPRNDYTSISARAYADGVIADVEAERQKCIELENRKKDIELRIKKLRGEQ